MLDKVKRYCKENPKDVDNIVGCAVSVISVWIIVKQVGRLNAPTHVKVKWANPEKTLLAVKVTQRNGKVNFGQVVMPD